MALAAACAAVIVLMYLWLKAKIRKYLDLGDIVTELREEVGRLTTELNQTTDRNLALVEDAMTRLRAELDRADRKIATVNREVLRREAEESTYAKLGRPRAKPAQETRIPSVPLEAASLREILAPEFPLPRGEDGASAPIGEIPASGPIAAVPAAAASEPRGEGVTDFDVLRRDAIGAETPRERVVSLLRKGFSTDVIAARLQMPIGEVELVAGLEAQLRSGGGEP